MRFSDVEKYYKKKQGNLLIFYIIIFRLQFRTFVLFKECFVQEKTAIYTHAHGLLSWLPDNSLLTTVG